MQFVRNTEGAFIRGDAFRKYGSRNEYVFCEPINELLSANIAPEEYFRSWTIIRICYQVRAHSLLMISYRKIDI